MKISVAAWTRYKDRLSKIDQRAVDEMTEFLRQIHGWEGHEPQVLAFAYGLSTKYGEAAAAAACEMYDTCARASGRRVPKAEPAPTATYNETAKAVRGTVKNRSESQIPNTVGRLVKQAGADTTLRNVARDGAQFAWVPSGDTCSFCIMLASNGWQYISKNTLKRGHAEHIHANCDCQYAVRFSEQDGVAGYDPDRYREIYDNADGNTWQEKLRSMQHDHYEAHKDERNARRRELYALRKNGLLGFRIESPSSSESLRKSLEAIRQGRAGLSEARKNMLGKVPKIGDYNSFAREKVSIHDLAYLSANTGHEFSLFRGKHDDILFHGNHRGCFIKEELANKLKTEGYKWVAHSHIDFGPLVASPADRQTLAQLGQIRSIIVGPTGEEVSFTQSEFD